MSSSLQSGITHKSSQNNSKSNKQKIRKKSIIEKEQQNKVQKNRNDNITVFFNKQGHSQYNHSHKSSSIHIHQNDKHSINSIHFQDQSMLLSSNLTKLKSERSHQKTKSKIYHNTKQKDQNTQVMKKLDKIKVQFKKIQQFEDQKNLQTQAKNFIMKLHQQKSQFQGRIYLLKKNQQFRKKEKQRIQKQYQFQEKQIKKILRKKQIEQKLQLFKQKQLQRIQQEQLRKKRKEALQKHKSHKLDKMQKIKLKRAHRYNSIEQIQPIISPTNAIGNKYLKQSGRIHRRSKTQSNSYNDLSAEQKQQLDKIRQKINILTKILNK